MLSSRRMMIAVASSVTPTSHPSTGASTTGRQTVTTGSFTPTANALVFVPAMIYDGNGTGHTITVSDTLGGLTWHEVTTGYYTNGRGDCFKTSIFWAIAPASPSAGTVTLSGTNSFFWQTIADVMEIASGFTPGSPIAQSANNIIESTTGDGTTTHSLTATLPSAPSGTVVAVLGQHYDNNTPAAPGADPDFTHVDFETGGSSLDLDVDTSYATGEQSVTWTGLLEGTASTSFTYWFYGLLVEIQ